MSFVLYVATKYGDSSQLCDGSQICIDIIKHIPPNVVTVQNCDVLRQKNVSFPSWLKGTPTLLVRSSNQVVTGGAAIATLHRLARHLSTNVPDEPAPPPATNVPREIRRDARLEEEPNIQKDEDAPDENLDNLWRDDNAEVRKYAREMEDQPKMSQKDVDAYIQQRQAMTMNGLGSSESGPL